MLRLAVFIDYVNYLTYNLPNFYLPFLRLIMKLLPKPISQNLKNSYKSLSTKGLGLALRSTVIGYAPEIDETTPTFYVMDEYSRSNSLLLENELLELGLPSALKPIKTADIDESSAMIFLKHRRAKSPQSPRLINLIRACLANPDLKVDLVPVTILWGRSPDKEESIFKLLMADDWRVPSISKQLFNIGVMGRDTFVQFYNAKNLQMLIADAKAGGADSEEAIIVAINERLKGYLLKQRTTILGPDLSDKQGIKTAILSTPAVQDAISKKSQETGKSVHAIKKEANAYIDEIASDYSYSVVRVFERFLTWLWTQLYDGVEVRHFERVRELAPDHQLIYVPCHRSHMDYLLLSYIVHTNGLRVPHVAAGANLNLPVVGEILRSGGAFFLRRSFRDNPLYGTVFKEYLHNLMERNAPIEYFIEGGRSRSGRLLAPKLGMVAMTVASYLKSPNRPVVFIPTYISYERIMEGATYVGELKGKPKESENLLGLIKTAKKIDRIFGTVHLSFGEPLYLDNFMQKFGITHANAQSGNSSDTQKNINAMVENIGVKILQNINKTAVVNPVSLIALVLLSAPKATLSESHIPTYLSLYQNLAKKLPYDKDTAVSEMSPAKMVDYGLKLKLIERTPHPLGNMIGVADKQAPMLSYFRNNVLHIFIMPSLISALVQRNGHIARHNLNALAGLLYPFLQAELFLKYASRNIESVISETLTVLIDEGVVVDLGNDMLAVPNRTSENYQKLLLLASPAQQSLERYLMTVTLLAKQGSGKLIQKQVVELCHLVGQRLSVLTGDDLPDSFDKGLFNNFINALIRTNYLTEQDGLLTFDERLTQIADYATLVLSSETIGFLHQATQIDVGEVEKLG